eukprot:Em0010g647a
MSLDVNDSLVNGGRDLIVIDYGSVIEFTFFAVNGAGNGNVATATYIGMTKTGYVIIMLYMYQGDRSNLYDVVLMNVMQNIPQQSSAYQEATGLLIIGSKKTWSHVQHMGMQPVLLTGSNLIAPAMNWTLPYLEQHMGSNKHTVYISKDNRKFKFYDEKKSEMALDRSLDIHMTTQVIANELRRIAKNDSEAIHYQDALTDAVGEPIKHDFVHFNWQWLNERKKRYNWGQLTSNLLLIGQPVNITPCHFDEQHNFFNQVDFDEPDLERFPNFQDCEGYECTVRAGEVLYIPMYWWHYFESIPKGQETISVTFWYKSGPLPNTIEYPLNGQQKTPS